MDEVLDSPVIDVRICYNKRKSFTLNKERNPAMREPKHSIVPELDDLLEKFTELLTGEATPERVEMVKAWALYSHMQKVMPPLVHHWGSEPQFQEAKANLHRMTNQIKQWNQEKNAKPSDERGDH
jgi:hypothetical protein